MRVAVLALAAHVHRACISLCLVLLALLLVAQCLVVVLRYGFGMGFLELQDFARYCFASLVLLGLPVALWADEHVRVDVWRERQSNRERWLTDAAAAVVLLVPACVLTLWLSLPDVLYAWSIREGSGETGGLGGLYLVKSMVPLSCLVMVLQSLAWLARPHAP